MPDDRLVGRRCLITGGSRGLGRAIALAFADAGAQVAITWHKRSDAAEDARQALIARGCEPLVLQGSVTDPEHAAAAVAACVDAWGGLDVLVNNAAVTRILPVALIEAADWDEVMAVNAKGAFLFSRAALKPMIRARAGHILNIGSFGVDRVADTPVHYAASKAALQGLTVALAREVGRYGIAVNLLAPGLLNQGLSERLPRHRTEDYLAQSALGRLGTPAEVARMAVWLVSPENAGVSGAIVPVDGGL